MCTGNDSDTTTIALYIKKESRKQNYWNQEKSTRQDGNHAKHTLLLYTVGVWCGNTYMKLNDFGLIQCN